MNSSEGKKTAGKLKADVDADPEEEEETTTEDEEEEPSDKKSKVGDEKTVADAGSIV